jgi:hypothetical protein
MNRTFILRSLFGVIVFGAIALQSAAPATAQEAQPESQQQLQLQVPPPPPPPLVNTAGRMRFFLTGDFGFGFDSTDVGTTTNGDKVSISGAGGLGAGVGFGYGLSRNLDLDFELGAQASAIRPAVSNAEGFFSRSFLLATMKYKMPTSDTGQLKFGVGLGAYSNGKLDIDARDAGGRHTVVKYDNSPGVHLTGEFERFIGQNTSLTVGAKMYFVKYKAESVTDSGASVSVDSLKSNVKEFNGNGLDLMVGLSRYF